ncbi:14090_t:CDS:2 [Ambispora leptoticha]|uniref:14090_t:CDS:1 n=1 Tax=Ambispora leptoticha TaxID=144679 RepID=A0A9N9AV03_9GLOM|nr:14090_t:CDS:2 [Ambispora leptoticha]
MSTTTTILTPTISLTTAQEEANSVKNRIDINSNHIEKHDQKNLVGFLGEELGIKFYPYLQFEDVTLLKRKDNAKSTMRTGFWTFRSKEVALKELPEIIKNDEEKSEKLYNELRSLKKLTIHENILQYHCITKDPESKKYLLVLQHVDNDDLHLYLEKNSREMSWVDKLRLTKGIAYALLHLHKSGIIHRHLNSSNILINRGRSSLTDPITFTLEYHSSSSQDILPFIDPKLLANPNLTPDSRSDVYSLGMIMWEISSGRQPFSFTSFDQDFINEIINGKRESPVVGTPIEYVQLYVKCWNSDPDQRPTIEEVCERLEDMMLTPVVQKLDHDFATEDEDEGVQSEENRSSGMEKRDGHGNDVFFNFDVNEDNSMEVRGNQHESKFDMKEDDDNKTDSSSNYPTSVQESDAGNEIGVGDNDKTSTPIELPTSELNANDNFTSGTHDPPRQILETKGISGADPPMKRKLKNRFWIKLDETPDFYFSFTHYTLYLGTDYAIISNGECEVVDGYLQLCALLFCEEVGEFVAGDDWLVVNVAVVTVVNEIGVLILWK